MPFRDHRLLDLLESTLRVGTWSLEVATRQIEWSPAAYAIHEKKAGEPVSVDSAVDCCIPAHRPVLRQCIERALEAGEGWDVELQIVTERGHTRWVRIVGQVVVKNGMSQRLYGIFQDINEKKELELQREHTLGLLVEGERAAKLGHWKADLKTGEIERSPGLVSLEGFTEGEAPPSPQQYIERIHPDDRQAFLAARATWGGQDCEPGVLRYRIVVAQDLRHFRVTATVQRGDEGKPRYLLGTVVDETESVQAKRRHEQLRGRHGLALEASRIGIWDLNLDTEELIWDEQMYKLYGIEEGQFDGAYAAWERGLHPEDKEAATAALQDSVRKQGKFDTQFRVLWPSGEVRVVRAMAQTQLGGEGHPTRLIGANWDVTESESTKLELERSNRELAQLAYRASHDLKAPLTTIKRLAQYSREDIEAGQLERASNDLERIVRQAESLEQLVVGILEVARADVSNTPIRDVAFDDLVEEVCDSLAAPCKEQGVVINTRITTRRSYRWPKVRLRQIVYNLTANAIRFSDPARKRRYVNIEISEQEERICIAIADNGLGIPSEVKGSIYDMFKTFHSARISGSGLGMYVVRKHVETLSGSITFESTREGTTFWVELPLSEAQ